MKKYSLLLLLFFGCGDSSSWSENTERIFLADCARSFTPTLCDCMLHKLEETYTEDEVFVFGKETEEGRLPTEYYNNYLRAAVKCQK